MNTCAPAAEGLTDVRRSRRLGEEGRGGKHGVVLRGEVDRPGVKPLGHRRLVRVDQRREGPHAHRPQPLLLLLLEPVGDPPSIRSARANAEPPVDRELLPLHVVTCNIVAWQAHESGCANTGSG